MIQLIYDQSKKKKEVIASLPSDERIHTLREESLYNNKQAVCLIQRTALCASYNSAEENQGFID